MSADRMIIPGDLPGANPPPARQAPPPPHVKPRTWSLPPEPGPEVKAVRCGCCAVRWTRTRRNGWSHDLWVPHNGGEIHGRYWRALVVDHTDLDHPLTDATETGADQ